MPLCGRQDETVQLYNSYEYIFETISGRIREEKFKRSYIISFSHALAHIRVAIATGYVAAHRLQNAYDITKNLLSEAEQYDLTGNYRGFILNAHAINAGRTGKVDESIQCLTQMVTIYLDYNEPYMVKVAINQMVHHLVEKESEIYTFLRNIGIIDSTFQGSDKAILIVSAAVDLENSLLGGLEQIIFGKQSASELKGYDREGQGLKAAYRSYGHWRQIVSVGA